MIKTNNPTQISQELEQLVRRYVSLGRCSPKGYEPTICAVCNDYKERGGFKFDPTGLIHYSCFNCGESNLYDPTKYTNVPRRFKDLLTTFGIPATEIEFIAAKAFLNPAAMPAGAQAPGKPSWSPPKTIEPPAGNLYEVTSDESPWCEVAREYIIGERALEPTDWPFYVSDDKRLEGRLIIPFTYKGNLIYWQARSMDKSIQPRYINPFAEKDKIIFNIDELSERVKEPLFVTEGPLDAISIGEHAVSMTGSSLSEWQLGELRKASKHRKIIFIIDKNYNGYKLGNKVLAEGWSVTVLPDNIDDANQARKRFGKLWLLSHISSTAVTGFAGKLLLQMKCEKEVTTQQTKHK